MWLPRLRRSLRSDASQSEPARQDDLQYLFVVTYGRSGSTLLMSLLDSMPGFCIRGENLGIVHDLFEFHRKAMHARDRFRGDTRLTQTEGGEIGPQHPWYGIDGYPEEEAVRILRELVMNTLLRPPPGTTVAGFKEIRWWKPKPIEYMDFLDTLFPNARYVLNTRNLDDVAVSKWHSKDPNSRERLENLENRLVKAVQTRGDRGYHVHFDDYVNDPTALKDFHDWLGAEYDEEHIRQLFGVKHSF